MGSSQSSNHYTFSRENIRTSARSGVYICLFFFKISSLGINFLYFYSCRHMFCPIGTHQYSQKLPKISLKLKILNFWYRIRYSRYDNFNAFVRSSKIKKNYTKTLLFIIYTTFFICFLLFIRLFYVLFIIYKTFFMCFFYLCAREMECVCYVCLGL